MLQNIEFYLCLKYTNNLRRMVVSCVEMAKNNFINLKNYVNEILQIIQNQ